MPRLLFGLLFLFGLSAQAELVTVGNPGNAADSTGYGAVSYSFQIAKYEYTNREYVGFLNAVDAKGINPYQIYNPEMGSNARGGIVFNSSAADGQKYSAKANMADKPVNFVGWREAARVANWMHNGQGAGGTETGAYTLNGSVAGDGLGGPSRNLDARFWIPTENEWYKAAYYSPEVPNQNNVGPGYYNYATQSDTKPTATGADAIGNGSAGQVGNFANIDKGAIWNSLTGNLTTVGTNGKASYYGTYDQAGNAAEWNDRDGLTNLNKGLRGGDWDGFTASSSFSRYQIAVGTEDARIGFRLAAAVPEPSSLALLGVAGLGGAWKYWRRKKVLGR